MQEEEIVYEVPEVAEETPIIDEPSADVVEVEMFEAFQSPTTADSFNHALLTNREIHDAHPITAITGLREELDSIEALQTVYSDKKGNADYYEWADGHAIGENGVGYFVTLNEDVRTISICTGDDIFGVVVDNAAFVGGQDDAARDDHYGLVATSGAVLVRCELDVAEDDYVISNAYGMATKASSGHGYKVVALHDIGGVPHATINLNISADQVHLMGVELQQLDSRMGAAESNIVSAVNVANEAHKQSLEAATSSSVSEEAVKEALESILNSEQKIEEFEQIVGSTSATAAQARAIAESAVTEAEHIRSEAVEVANNAWIETNNLIKDLEPITTWEDPAGTGISGADYLATQMNDGIATSYDVKVVDTKTDKAMSAIIRNGKELQSLVTVIDKYSVGPHSQAYGFTLEQAASVIEEDMIYVPTENVTEIYEYVDADGATQTYERSFVPGFLYKWGKLTDYPYGWITVDKDYVETDETNTSSKAVYFTTSEPVVSGNFGYWYTDGDAITGTTGTYESHTLYKWETSDDGAYWFAVATLAGNSSNRAVSQIRQDANSIELRVANTDKNVAALDIRVTDTESEVQSLASWTKDADGSQYNLATIKQTADDAGASIAQVVESVGEDGEVTAASIVTAINNGDSSVVIDANHVNITADNIDLTGYVKISDLSGEGTTEINGANIITGTIEAEQIAANAIKAKHIESDAIRSLHIESDAIKARHITANVIGAEHIQAGAIEADKIATDAIRSRNYYTKDADGNETTTKSGEGMKLDLANGTWDSAKLQIDSEGKITATDGEFTGTIHAKSGTIGGWEIADEVLVKNSAGILSSEKAKVSDSPIRFFAGLTEVSDKLTVNVEDRVSLAGFFESTVSVDYFVAENFNYEIGTIQYSDSGATWGSLTLDELEFCSVSRTSPTTIKVQIQLPSGSSAIGALMKVQLFCTKASPKFMVLDNGSLICKSEGAVNGWTLGEATIPVDGSSSITAIALAGESQIEVDNTINYQYVWLTPTGVYVKSSIYYFDDSGNEVHSNTILKHKNWFDLLSGS